MDGVISDNCIIHQNVGINWSDLCLTAQEIAKIRAGICVRFVVNLASNHIINILRLDEVRSVINLNAFHF